MHKLIRVVAHAISDKISCTDTYIHMDKCYKLQVYWGRWTRPDTYICSASAQKAELKVVGLGGEDIEWGKGKCASFTRGAAFETDWWWFGVFQ